MTPAPAAAEKNIRSAVALTYNNNFIEYAIN